jgi:predicted house-cleaning NTP pyrophosphatase (Maf/HAM1 superfamily)
MLTEPGARLVLASTSSARRAMLAAAGVAVEIEVDRPR